MGKSMTKDDVFNKLKEILIAEFELDGEQIVPDAKLFEELGLDSIDAVDLIVKMKNYTVKKIEPDAFKEARTVQDVVEILFPLVKNK
ncbi:MAG: phosphopantetheine-binding protein [Spirochaetaceae bacterium]|jgi:acyl carrier protein|nr:phosphopantetheine-binding protein [Spirochaetaceae bacterium]